MIRIFALASYFSLLTLMCRPAQQTELLNDHVLNNNIPPTFQKVLDHHGINQWQEMKSLEFEVANKGESYLFDLQTRDAKINTEHWGITKQGQDFYVSPKLSSYDGDPIFYHNIYFYFTSMPFVLADPGITYETIGDYTMGDTLYHAVKIKYDDGVGDASKDEYIVLSDKESNEMRYLLYTVTYFSNEKSDQWGLKRYGNWKRVNGVLLPQEITSIEYDGHEMGEIRRTDTIADISLERESPEPLTFNAPSQSELYIRTN